MTIDVATHIGHLLYQHESVIIPNLGGFVSSYQPAVIDYAQGFLHPPSRALGFNENLAVNDGVLISFIKEKHGLSAQEARMLVEDFVRSAQFSLEHQQQVEIPEVGRLFRDGEQKICFLPEKTNFNTQSYALPTLQFYPIARTREQVTEAVQQVQTEALVPRPMAPARRRWPEVNWSDTRVPALVLSGLLTLTICAFLWYRNTQDSQRQIAANHRTKPVNAADASHPDQVDLGNKAVSQDNTLREVTPPPPEPASEPATKPETASREQFDQLREKGGEADQSAIADKETIYPPGFAGKKACVVIVGGFRDKNNARKMSARLRTLGWEPYDDQSRGLTRVGARFEYETPADIEREVRRIKREVNSGAWVLSK